MNRGTLVLSPHADDAALSVGGALQRSFFPSPVTVATLFGRSNYSRDGGFHADWTEVTSIRRAEDERYATRLGIDLDYRELPEASLRDVPIFAKNARETIAIPEGLEPTLRDLLAATRPSEVLIPLGLGHHVDHLVVHHVALAWPFATAVRRWFYEDLPYAAALGGRVIRRRARDVGLPLEPIDIDITEVVDQKIDALSIYASQLEPRDLRKVARHRRRFGRTRERLWRETR
ncbi:MAG: PIG-L family deacetylase [Acidobacteriota bacterium]